MEVPPAAPPPRSNRSLRRELGLREAVALGVGGTVGGGIFVLVGVAAGHAGPAALAAFALAFAAALVIALPYAELACRVPLAGGGYAFVRQALGPHWGFVMGWGYWGAYVFVSGYVTLGFGGYLEAVTGWPATAGALGLVACCALVNLAGVKLSGRAQAVVVLVAVSGLVGFVAWGLPAADLDRLTPFAPQGAQGIFLAALVAFVAFGGFDMVAAAGEEIRQPERTLPRAILATLVIVLALYALVTAVALGAVGGERLGASVAPLADAAESFGGPTARGLMVVVALLTTAATANAVLVVTSRIVFGMARDRLLPERLSAVSGSGAPWAAVTANAVLLAAVAALGSVAFAATAGGFLYVLHFLPPLVALVALRRRDTAARPAFRTPAPRLVLPLAFLAGGALLAASGRTGLVSGLGWLGAGLVFHAVRLRVPGPISRRPAAPARSRDESPHSRGTRPAAAPRDR